MITLEHIDDYQENGYLLVKSVFSKNETDEFHNASHDLIERLKSHSNVDATWGSALKVINTPLKTQIYHCHDVQFYSSIFSKLIINQRLTDITSLLMGTPNVQLHHTKLFIKPPEKGSPFPMHQDYPYFPHEKHSMVAAVVHFDDAPLEKGCIRVIPGSHKLGPLEHDSTGGWHLPVEKYPVNEATPCPAEAGDILFFSYLTIHGSGINSSNEARTTLLIQMRDPTDLPTVKTHLSRGQGMMLRGINPLGKLHPPE